MSNLKDHDNFIRVNLAREDEMVVLRTVNSYVPSVRNFTGGGLGLNNLKKRLELIYPGHYLLEQKSDDHIYESLLKVKIR